MNLVFVDIETLTRDERDEIRDSPVSYEVGCKALRIIDAQAERITAALALAERAQAEATDPFSSEERVYAWGRESAEALKRFTNDLRKVLRGGVQ